MTMTGRTWRYAACLQNAADKARYCSNGYMEFAKRDAAAQDAETMLGERLSLTQPQRAIGTVR
jgi:hypothetical protein